MSRNQIVYLFNTAYAATPPTNTDTYFPGPITSAIVDTTTNEFSVDVTNRPTGNTNLLVLVTKALSNNVYAAVHRLNLLALIAPAGGWPRNFWTTYTTYYPAPLAGQRFGVGVRGANFDSLLNTALNDWTIVTAS
jgi:hypothetical protein